MGEVRRVGLGRVETTLLWPLHHKVLDFRNREPVLGDVWAVDVLDHLEVDRRDVRGTSGDRYLTLLRAAWMDARVRAWVAAHPEGTVVHPGCGLDARALRVGVPERGLWVDLDLPGVVALRRGLLPEPRGYRLVAGCPERGVWVWPWGRRARGGRSPRGRALRCGAVRRMLVPCASDIKFYDGLRSVPGPRPVAPLPGVPARSTERLPCSLFSRAPGGRAWGG